MSLESTKADEIALVIEQAIVSGELLPGTVLRQEQLSERFAVSRTPVREALRRLAALGLVSFEPNRGVRVRTLSPEELREAFLVRAELESLATELAAPRMTETDLDALERAESGVQSRHAGPQVPFPRRSGALAAHLRLGSRQPRLSRRDLPGRRLASRGAAREERTPLFLGACRLGAAAARRRISSTSATTVNTARSSRRCAPAARRELARLLASTCSIRTSCSSTCSSSAPATA